MESWFQGKLYRGTRENCKTLSVGGGGGGGGWLLNDKGHTLTLVDVVKCQTAYKSIWVSCFALVDFIEHQRRVSATKHGQLPQCPVSPIVVAWHRAILPVNMPDLIEFEARDPSFLEHVVNLLCNWIIREWWKVGQSLKLLVVDWVPYLHAVSSWTIGDGFLGPSNRIFNRENFQRVGWQANVAGCSNRSTEDCRRHLQALLFTRMIDQIWENSKVWSCTNLKLHKHKVEGSSSEGGGVGWRRKQKEPALVLVRLISGLVKWQWRVVLRRRWVQWYFNSCHPLAKNQNPLGMPREDWAPPIHGATRELVANFADIRLTFGIKYIGRNGSSSLSLAFHGAWRKLQKLLDVDGYFNKLLANWWTILFHKLY